MTLLQILGLVLLVCVVAVVFFVRPKGARDAAGTRMMTAARTVLLVVAVIVALALIF